MAGAQAFATAVKDAAPTTLLGSEGWYNFSHPQGEMQVCLRPGGVFFCQQFQEAARWCIKPGTNTLAIAWGRYGMYELEVAGQSPLQFSGSTVGNPADWRKMQFAGPLSPAEAKLLSCAGGGTAWQFVHAGGEFEVQFRGDGYNHFVCESYPAHSHWSLGGAARDELTITWGHLGIYEMKIDPTGFGQGSMQGVPADWRKMAYIRDLPSCCALEDCAHH